jgi:hypothetical protein
MKIVILGPAYPYRGGIAAFNERIAYQLMEEGHEVEILTFTVQYPSFLFPGKTQYSESPSPAGLSIERVANSCNPFNWIKVGRKIRKMNPDMLIVKFWIPLLAPCLGTKCNRAKYCFKYELSKKFTPDNFILRDLSIETEIAYDEYDNNLGTCICCSKENRHKYFVWDE